MWDSSRAPVSRRTETTSSASTRIPAKIRLLQRGKIPIYEPGLEELVRRNRDGEAADLHHRARAGRPQRADHLHRGRHAHRRGRLGGPAARARRGARSRARDERLQGRRQQEHRAGRHGRQGPGGHPARNHAPLQRRQQPGVPEAGRGDRRLHEARSRRHRRRGSARRRADERALRAVHPHRRADHDDGLRQRRAEQVCGERDAGDAHLVHERSRERLRGGRGERRLRSARRSRRIGGSVRRSCFLASATAAAAFPRTSRRCCTSPRRASTTSRF